MYEKNLKEKIWDFIEKLVFIILFLIVLSCFIILLYIIYDLFISIYNAKQAVWLINIYNLRTLPQQTTIIKFYLVHYLLILCNFIDQK